MRKSSIVFALVALIVALVGGTASAHAQSTATPAVDSVAVKVTQPTPDEALANLQKAAEELSRSVEVAATKIVNNPEIQVAALQVAAGALSLAQKSLADQIRMIEAALNSAARQIADAQSSIAKKKQ
ncbi:MAG: hypothetical protein H0W69_08085 [Gemmatimonadaceae bacterium]|nr:hypothetical protein [Gemmatimonadaceae bacterium]